ncbi:hypothetical protein COMA2_50009 [Candidatus Nitrospira nitrificans]|uniref:Uncharacterized protein n=1 Tax=Candidatus Nitrospira nitrificans TaxID=1742973 RepID=A0A0S4LMX7_9BACT|nr:hypothetical protein COMA2_50009 [Candidatus Nitrospira nitrificans]
MAPAETKDATGGKQNAVSVTWRQATADGKPVRNESNQDSDVRCENSKFLRCAEARGAGRPIAIPVANRRA